MFRIRVLELRAQAAVTVEERLEEAVALVAVSAQAL